jgi:hypothetical protein
VSEDIAPARTGRLAVFYAKAAPTPVLFVRRGTRPGALAPRADVTRFTWSSPGAPDISLEPG